MTTTTIKVDSALRDQLKEQAHQSGQTLGHYLQTLADGQEHRLRIQRMRDAMTANPPDQAYFNEAREWLADAWN